MAPELCDGLVEEIMNFCWNLSKNCCKLFKCANSKQIPIEAEVVSKAICAKEESKSRYLVCWNMTDNL